MLNSATIIRCPLKIVSINGDGGRSLISRQSLKKIAKLEIENYENFNSKECKECGYSSFSRA